MTQPGITIRRCTLRVARRGGWSWGADPQSLVKRAVERLPALLERRLTDLATIVPAHTDIATPVQVRVTLSRAEWDALVSGAEAAPVRERFEAAFDASMARALPPALREAVQVAQRSASSSAQPPEAVESAAALSQVAPRPQPSALWRLVLQWRAAGSLLMQLAALERGVLRGWLARLIDSDVHVPGPSASLDENSLSPLWQMVCAMPVLLPAGTARELVRRVVFVIELRTRWPLSAPQLRGLLQHVCGAQPPESEESPPPVRGAAADPRLIQSATAEAVSTVSPIAASSARGARAPDATFEVDIPCALPFLMLTPLARAGYLARLAAALEVAHATGLAAGVALGLAHKCLAVPQRGWLRDAGSLSAAAAFAGLQGADNDLIPGAARALRSQLGLLDGCITEQMLRGHRAGAGWLVGSHATDSLVLFDEDGLAPVAIGELAALAPRIAPSGAVLFVPAKSATAKHFDALDELQIPYASDGHPGVRASCASFVARDGTRLWISTHGAQQGRARGLAGRGTSLVEAALINWNALHERSAQRSGLDASFEISLSLAAGFALSALAWTLWRHRARATALAALENFADLDARVRITPERVHVVLPMGRRAWDLRDHGLLGDVHDVPWLGARTVTFGVG